MAGGEAVSAGGGAAGVKPRLFTVDVFATQPYTGNPLAVVVDADWLAEESMQQIAAEIDYSETTFVMTGRRGDDGAWLVRMFTPAREIAFAGHAILGTAWVIRRHLALGEASVRLNTTVGPLRVGFETTATGEVAWFAAPPVSSGAVCAPEPIAAALGLVPADIDTRAPVQQYTAGVAALVVPLRGLDALRRARLDLAAFAPLAAAGFAPLVYLFCRETRDAANDLAARFYFEANGVREYPATGNGAAFLGYYLLAHRWLGPARCRCASSRVTRCDGRRSCGCARATSMVRLPSA